MSAVLSISAVSALNMNYNSQKSDLSDLSLANVEALADEGTPSYNCPGTEVECVRITTTPGAVHIFYKDEPTTM
ncbi:MAG: NVEALA domain-containing protein [Prevotellaceae bacterium]|nr:NVEALA domain-containing protein [Prevotellaceae bacterium]